MDIDLGSGHVPADLGHFRDGARPDRRLVGVVTDPAVYARICFWPATSSARFWTTGRRGRGWRSAATPAGTCILRRNKPILSATHTRIAGGVRVTVTAHTDVYLQEPGLTAKVAGDGMWRGFGKNNRWVSTTGGVDGWLPLAKEKDGVAQAFTSTVHFSRVKSSPRYCLGVEYRDSGGSFPFPLRRRLHRAARAARRRGAVAWLYRLRQVAGDGHVQACVGAAPQVGARRASARGGMVSCARLARRRRRGRERSGPDAEAGLEPAGG